MRLLGQAFLTLTFFVAALAHAQPLSFCEGALTGKLLSAYETLVEKYGAALLTTEELVEMYSSETFFTIDEAASSERLVLKHALEKFKTLFESPLDREALKNVLKRIIERRRHEDDLESRTQEKRSDLNHIPSVRLNMNNASPLAGLLAAKGRHEIIGLSADGKILRWNQDSGEVLSESKLKNPQKVTAFSLSTDERFLVIGQQDSTLTIFNLDDNSIHSVRNLARGPINALASGYDKEVESNYLLIGVGHELFVWYRALPNSRAWTWRSVIKRKLFTFGPRKIATYSSAILSVALSPRGKRFAVTSGFGLELGRLLNAHRPWGEVTTQVLDLAGQKPAFSRDGDLFWISGGKLKSASVSHSSSSWMGGGYYSMVTYWPITASATSGNNKYLFIGTQDGSLFIHDQFKHKTLKRISAHAAEITSIQPIGNDLITTLAADHSARVWKISDLLSKDK